MSFTTLLTKLFKDNKGKTVIWQIPNIPILGWLLLLGLGHVLPLTSRWQLTISYLSFGLIFAWAWLEVTQGTTYFRRILGAVVLIFVIYSRLK